MTPPARSPPEYRRALSAELYPRFLERYREALFTMVPDERPYFFTFRQILAQAIYSRPSIT